MLYLNSILIMIRSVLLLLFFILASCTSSSENREMTPTRSIITAGGTITEIVNALGLGNEITATDITSTYPESMKSLPSIGYRNHIKAEGILSLAPDLVLIEEGYLNPDVVTQLKAASVAIHSFPNPTSVASTKNLVLELAEFFDQLDKGKAINEAIDTDIAELNTYLNITSLEPHAIFLMTRGPETVFIAGDKTFASEMFKLAKIQTSATGFDEFAPMTPESLVKMNPEYLIFFESGIKSLGGREGLSAIQGIEQTEAFKKDQIVSLDGQYLSGFGPRVGKAALDLAKAVRK